MNLSQLRTIEQVDQMLEYIEERGRKAVREGRHETAEELRRKWKLVKNRQKQFKDGTLTTCWRCQSTGEYKWGATVNGVISHRGPCWACDAEGVRWKGRIYERRLPLSY